MTPAEWNAALAPGVPWQTAFRTVATEARACLALRSDTISTTDLANALYPAQFADGSNIGMAARRRLFKALFHLAERELSDCATRGPEKRVRGRTGRAWLWHKSTGIRQTVAALSGALLAAVETILDGADTEEAWQRLEVASDALRAHLETEKPAGAYEAYMAGKAA